MTSNRAATYALTLVALSQTMSLLDRNIVAILAPRIKADLHIGDAEMGLLYGTVFALFYAVFSLPIGRLVDGWVRTYILSLSIGFWSIMTGLAAFANGFGLLALSRIGVGIGEASTQPAGMSLVQDHFPKERRGFVMAVLAAAIACGLGGSLILGAVATDWWDATFAAGSAPFGFKGWQFAFLVAASPGLVLAILLWRMPEPKRGRLDGIIAPPDPAPFRASAAMLGAITPGTNLLTMAANKASARSWMINLGGLVLIIGAMMAMTGWTSAFSPRPPLVFGQISINPHALQWSVIGLGLFVVLNWVQHLYLSDRPAFAVIVMSPTWVMVMAVGALQSVINYGVMAFTPSFLMKTYGLSMSQTALQFGLLSATLGIIGPLISGPLSDKFNIRFPGTGRIAVTLFSLAVSPLLGIWTYHAPDSTSFYLRFIGYSLLLTMWLPPLYAVMFGQVLPRMRGTMTSLYIMVMTILGLGIGPYAVGMFSDANGGNLSAAILSINWVAVVIVTLLILIMLRVRRDESLVLPRAKAAGEQLL
jgi:MFS transporter, Spinster family, sphingosine-1-phosphate transporter